MPATPARRYRSARAGDIFQLLFPMLSGLFQHLSLCYRCARRSWQCVDCTTTPCDFKLPHIYFLKNILQNIFRNQIVAHIFATNRFRIKSNNMRRDIFQAIADPTRRAIITLIALQAMTPNAIADNFNTTRQSVSKHLRILTECELVKQEQKGREIYYSLEIQKMKEIDKWLNQFRKIWEDRFNQLDKVLLTMKKKKK
jgi:DNA-binding transcriptional ArsR family regulator